MPSPAFPDITIERLGVIGDVHTEDRHLTAALEHFRAEGVDHIVCTGDVVTGQGDAEACLTLLRERQIPTVRGNHDRWFVAGETGEGMTWWTRRGAVSHASFAWLAALPATLEINTTQGLALLCHGLGDNDMSLVYPSEDPEDMWITRARDLVRFTMSPCRFYINGHSHYAMVKPIPLPGRAAGNPFTILNAGTLRRDHQPCLALFDFAAARATFWDFNPQGCLVPQSELDIR